MISPVIQKRLVIQNDLALKIRNSPNSNFAENYQIQRFILWGIFDGSYGHHLTPVSDTCVPVQIGSSPGTGTRSGGWKPLAFFSTMLDKTSGLWHYKSYKLSNDRNTCIFKLLI